MAVCRDLYTLIRASGDRSGLSPLANDVCILTLSLICPISPAHYLCYLD